MSKEIAISFAPINHFCLSFMPCTCLGLARLCGWISSLLIIKYAIFDSVSFLLIRLLVWLIDIIIDSCSYISRGKNSIPLPKISKNSPKQTLVSYEKRGKQRLDRIIAVYSSPFFLNLKGLNIQYFKNSLVITYLGDIFRHWSVPWYYKPIIFVFKGNNPEGISDMVACYGYTNVYSQNFFLKN